MSGYANLKLSSYTKQQVYGYLAVMLVIGGAVGFGITYGVMQDEEVPPPVEEEEEPLPSPSFEPIIDGFINESEWEYADWFVSEYFDVDNSIDPATNTSCVDGFNHFYVGQTNDSLYIAIDLCSDQTNNTEEEWLGIFLNTMNRSFGYDFDYHGVKNHFADWKNNGTESLVIITETNETAQLFSDARMRMMTPIWSEDAGYSRNWSQTIYGYPDWSGWDWENTFDIFSSDTAWVFWESEDIMLGGQTRDRIMINFTVDIREMIEEKYWIDYPMPDSYWNDIYSDIDDMTIDLHSLLFDTFVGDFVQTSAVELATIDVLDDGLSPFEINFTGATFPVFDQTQINVDKSAYADGILNFTIYIVQPQGHDLDFILDYLMVNFNGSIAIDTMYGDSSITEYEIAWDFTTSPNCDVNHRTFEICIPLDQIEGFNQTGDLELFIQGYGTMSFGFNIDTFVENPTYSFSGGTQFYNEPIFMFSYEYWTPFRADWSVNYYSLQMGQYKGTYY